MNLFALALVVVLTLASLGVAAWTWLALTRVGDSLSDLGDFAPMHFDVIERSPLSMPAGSGA